MPTNRNTKSSPSKKLQTDYQYLEDDNNGQQAAADKNEPRSPSSPSSYRSASNEELLNTKQRSRRTLLWGGKRPSSSSQHGREGSWCGGFGDNSDGNTVSSSSRSVFSQSEDFKRIFDRKRKSQQQQDGQGALIAAQSEGDETNSQFQEEEEVYLVKQHYGYCSIVFSIGQIGVLITMMVQCGVAPLNINPMIGPYPDALSEWGGKNAVNILDDGEWWRLITPIMLHAGVIHLLCNVAVQVETGAFFEREWGSRNWLIVYLTSAVGSSILSVIFMPDAVSVGSSGAVMGLFGGKLAEVICRACESNKTQQGRIGHQVRKEQCAGATCSVIIVMLFSFIPYGKFVVQ